MNRSLLDITDDMRALDQLLAEADGDISDEQVQQYVEQLLGELDTDFETKADNYAALITEMKFRATSRKAEADRLAARAKTDDQAAKFLSEKLKTVMQQRGMKKLETRRYRLSVAGNGGKRPLDVHVAAHQMPARFQKVEVTHNKDAIRDALEAGEEVEGAVLMERGTRLSIK